MKREPAKTKHRKWHKKAGIKKGNAARGTKVSFGDFGLKAVTGSRITFNQLESARIAMARYMKRQGKLWIRVSLDKPITKKPNETGMGKGKGSVDHYVVMIRPGQVLFELSGIPQETAAEAVKLAAFKLPIKAKFVKAF